MAENKNENNLKVQAEIVSRGKITQGNIVIRAEKFHKVIPAVLFTPEEAKILLEIVDKVEAHLKTVY